MGKAARAIIIENDKILVMHRSKEGSEYFTLVGGRVNEDESLEDGVKREVREETGLEVINTQQVFYEEHPEPYNHQYIFLCEVSPHGDVSLQEYSEENMLNRLQTNIHTPIWVPVNSFGHLPFRTPQLQEAIVKSLSKGFPKEPTKL